MKIALLLYVSIFYHGAFEYKTGDPDSLFPHQTAIHDYSTPAVMMTPALLPFSNGLLFSSNAGRPYSEEVLTTGGSAIQYGGGDYGLQFSWNSFGADFYREHTFSLKGGYSIYPFLQLGIAENLYFLKIATGDLSLEREMTDTDLAFILSPLTWFNAAFIQTGIVSLCNKQNRDMIYPERSAGILLKPGKGFTIAWNITDTAAARVNTIAASINPTSFFSLKGGYCRETSSFSASIGVLAENFFVSYGLKYHPYLGYTHSIGLTYSMSPKVESLAYGRPLFSSSRKKINIKNATSEELKDIEGLSSQSAERIILYREKIGPLNEKSLIQIGLSSEEITILETNTYGLERSPRNKDGEKDLNKNHKKFVKKPPRKERVKQKFRGLISKGIPAFTAITYSELSESGDSNQFHNRLNSDKSLSNDQKQFIEKICLE